jgi:MFS transporter, DHA1 family, multidrug resistance protein
MSSWLPHRLRFGPLEPWRRSQYVVVLTVAMSAIGSDLTQPFLGLYIRELGMTDPAEVSLWAGMAVGAGPIGSMIMSPLWGALADRFGRKAMVLRALIMVSLLQMVQAFAPDAHWLVAARLVHGMFAGFSAMAMALAVSLGPRERMGEAIGMVQAARLLPDAFGPLLGGVLSDHFGLRTNFFVTGAYLLIPIGVMFFLVQERDYNEPGEQRSPRKRPAERVSRWSYLAIPGFAAALGVNFVARFCDKALPPILPLFLAEIDTPKAQLGTITGLIVSLGAIAACISATLYGRARPEHTRRLLLTALGGGAVCSVLLGFSSTWQQVLVLRLLLGLLAGGTLSLGYAIGARLAPSERFGLTLGILASCGQLGSGSAPLLAGVLGGAGLHVVFFANATVYLLGLVMAALVMRKPRGLAEPGPA